MKFMTEDAFVRCAHPAGNVKSFAPAQSWVTINNRRVLVEPDPVGRPMENCTNVPPQGVQCTLTLAVQQGYSALLSVDGQRICLDTVQGLTNGVAPVPYTVLRPGQQLLDSDT